MDPALDDPNALRARQLQAEAEYINFHGRAPPPGLMESIVREEVGGGRMGQMPLPPLNGARPEYGVPSGGMNAGVKRGRGVEDDEGSERYART